MRLLLQGSLGGAGFAKGENYQVPYNEIDVPESLLKKIFPFVEAALASTTDKCSIALLETLIFLRKPFFHLCAQQWVRDRRSIIFHSKKIAINMDKEALDFYDSYGAKHTAVEEQRTANHFQLIKMVDPAQVEVSNYVLQELVAIRRQQNAHHDALQRKMEATSTPTPTSSTDLNNVMIELQKLNELVRGGFAQGTSKPPKRKLIFEVSVRFLAHLTFLTR